MRKLKAIKCLGEGTACVLGTGERELKVRLDNLILANAP